MLITRNILLVAQVVFDTIVPRVATTADTVLPPVVVKWGGGGGGKMYRMLLTRRLLNKNYQFHMSVLLAPRNCPRYPLDRQSIGTRDEPWHSAAKCFSGPLH